MLIKTIKVNNYRTLEEINLEFCNYYTAICGKNDSGKSNIINVILNLFKSETYSYIDMEFSIKDDFTKWKVKEKSEKIIKVETEIKINRKIDNELYDFILTYLSLKKGEAQDPDDINLKVIYSLSDKEPKEDIKIELLDSSFEGNKAKEVLKKIQSSRVIIYHNSTYQGFQFGYDRFDFDFVDEPGKDESKIENNLSKQLTKKIKNIAKTRQKAITDLLGRLTDKYKVELTIPKLVNRFPLEIALSTGDYSIPLQEWGSGTQNRTRILINLLQAKKISSNEEISKITPIFVIEEPESFLHPSAQAEFGKLLQDLANELKIQVVTTTHSPYMLSNIDPSSNILLCRKNVKNKLLNTIQISTSNDEWMEPFANILGINDDELKPWKDTFFTQSDRILFVEGMIDKFYFEEIKKEEHGKNKLNSKIEIHTLDGIGNFNNTVLLKFIKSKNKNVFFLFDLDAQQDIEKTSKSLNWTIKIDYFFAGQQEGRKEIEDCIPDYIKSKVYSNYPRIVDKISKGDKSAKNEIKRLIQEEFLQSASIENRDYDEFYKLTKIINKALN